jgi:antitoxin YefM
VAVFTYTQLRQNLASVMDEVCEGRKPVVITRQNAGSVVMLSLEEFESWEETLHLLRSRANAKRLARSIAQADAGKLRKRELRR